MILENAQLNLTIIIGVICKQASTPISSASLVKDIASSVELAPVPRTATRPSIISEAT